MNKITVTNMIVVAVLALVAWYTSASTIEILGALTGLICVWAYGRQYIWTATIAGVANVLAWTYMFYEVRLYAEMTLQIAFFLPLTIYGLYFWLSNRKNGDKVARTRYATKKEKYDALIYFLIGSAVWAIVLSTATDSSLPWVDAPLAVAQIIAQLFLSRKILGNWLWWIAVDLIMIGILAYKDLYLTAGLYGVFLINAIVSYISWKRQGVERTL